MPSAEYPCDDALRPGLAQHPQPQHLSASNGRLVRCPQRLTPWSGYDLEPGQVLTSHMRSHYHPECPAPAMGDGPGTPPRVLDTPPSVEWWIITADPLELLV